MNSSVRQTEIGDAWDELVTEAQDVATRRDRDRWYLGELATRVQRAYGEQAIEKFAADVGKVRRSTLYEYAAVFSFYPVGIQNELEMLDYSYFRVGMKLTKEGWTLEDICELLTETNDQVGGKQANLKTFSAYVDSVLGKQVIMRVLDTPCTVLSVDAQTGTLVLCADDVGSALVIGMSVRCVLSAREKAA